MNILVVDDHEPNRLLWRAMLEAGEFSVVEAADGIDALGLLECEKIHAIVSDILMPRMDGYRLCHEIRASERFFATPLIICTATYISSDDEKLALECGAD